MVKSPVQRRRRPMRQQRVYYLMTIRIYRRRLQPYRNVLSGLFSFFEFKPCRQNTRMASLYKRQARQRRACLQRRSGAVKVAKACTQTNQAHRRQRLAGVIPVWRAEHRRKSGGSPARLSGGAADAPFRDGPDFREAQGTRRARRPGRLSFPPFLWRDKEKGSGAGRSPALNQPRATARLNPHS